MIDKLYQYDWHRCYVLGEDPIIYKRILPVAKETKKRYYLDEKTAHAYGILYLNYVEKPFINKRVISNSVFLDHEDDLLARQLLLQFRKQQLDIAKRNFDREQQRYDNLQVAPITTNDPYYDAHMACVESSKAS